VTVSLPNRATATGIAVVALVLGIYGVAYSGTFAPGYEPMYAAGAQGILHSGVPQLLRTSALFAAARGGSGPPPAHGRVFPGASTGWGGPFTAIPIVAAGLIADEIRGIATGHRTPTFLLLAAHLNAAVLMAATAALLFICAVILFGDTRRAAGLTVAYGLTTLAFPYARIGMEPPLVFWTMAAVTCAILARRRPGLWWPLLVGVSTGVASATRTPVAPVFVLPVVLYAILQRRERTGLRTFCVLAPFVAGNLVEVAYNVARCSKLVCGVQYVNTAQAPAYQGFLGFLLSPGKSVFVTSPILVLAVVGIVSAWRRARPEALLVLGLFAIVLAGTSKLTFWADEIFGPRYLLFVIAPATLMIGYALGWDGQGILDTASYRRRLRAFVALAVVGAVVQVSAVLPAPMEAPCAEIVKPLLGPQRFDQNSCRWVPELSDPVLGLRTTAALVRAGFRTTTEVFTYAPYGGAGAGNLPVYRTRVTIAPTVGFMVSPRGEPLAVSAMFGLLAFGGAAWLFRRQRADLKLSATRG
jgi:hypothetical protein